MNSTANDDISLRLEQAGDVLEQEAEALRLAKTRLDAQFARAVDLILGLTGRLIVTGMGKPGHIAAKIAATLMSTGTPACFLHPAEGVHGDLGMITRQDAVLMLSNSGETREIVNLLPVLRRMGIPIIALCGDRHSTLAKHADIFLDAGISHEACPLNLAPTTSTTVALGIGDALAVVLMKARRFSADDFALFHPGGLLGRKLLLTVAAVMHSGDDQPLATPAQTITDALFIMTDKGLGGVSIVDKDGRLLGLITDGDIRRYISQDQHQLLAKVKSIMTVNPLVIHQDKLAAEAVKLMEQHQPKPITLLPVIDNEQRVVGMVHITDLMRNTIL